MTVSSGYSILIILVMAAVTFGLRATPFILFSKTGKTPAIITYLGNGLPPAVIAMLIIYCFRNTAVSTYPFGLPEVLAALLVVLLHLWKRNNLLSILGGTCAYMLLVQVVFLP